MRSVALAALATLWIASAGAQVPEIPNPALGDIAMVTLDPMGRPIIVYNPRICAQAGPALCGFYRAHEHGHIQMGHAYSRSLPQQREAEADCWAAKNASPAEVDAALRWFSSGGGSSWHHGTGAQRAARVRACYEGGGGGGGGGHRRPGGREDFQCLRECRESSRSCRNDHVQEAIECRRNCRGSGSGLSDCLSDCRSSESEARDTCARGLRECQAGCRD